MNNLEQISKNFTEDYALVSSNEALNDLRVKYLGKTGVLTDALKAIKDIPVAEKKAYGESVNELKKSIEAKLETLKLELENREIEAKLSSTKVVDLTIPSRTNEGSLHPVTIASHKVVEVFRSMGFLVEDGFEVETEYNNFEAVNIPKNHPARDMQDTFWLENDQVLRTHTSANQNRVMKKYGAPLRIAVPGRCFRNEDLDASHENTFFQLEGMVIDKNISISNLIWTMEGLLKEIFKTELPVIIENESLYIPLDIVNTVCNANINLTKKSLTISSIDKLVESCLQIASRLGYSMLSSTYENVRAIPNNMLVVGDGSKYGVISLIDGKNILGVKYDDIIYIQNQKCNPQLSKIYCLKI